MRVHWYVTEGIDEIDWIIVGVVVEVRPSIESILAGPPARLRVILAGAEVHQPGQRIIQATPEAERLESGVSVEKNIPKHVVVQLLGDTASRRIDHQSRAPQLV